METKLKKIVLAYSGGLDTSVIIKWLKEKYRCDIIAFAADVGQGDELETVRERALATGASRVYIEDLKEEFASDFLFPMLRANAFYENNYLLVVSLSGGSMGNSIGAFYEFIGDGFCRSSEGLQCSLRARERITPGFQAGVMV